MSWVGVGAEPGQGPCDREITPDYCTSRYRAPPPAGWAPRIPDTHVARTNRGHQSCAGVVKWEGWVGGCGRAERRSAAFVRGSGAWDGASRGRLSRPLGRLSGSTWRALVYRRSHLLVGVLVGSSAVAPSGGALAHGSLCSFALPPSRLGRLFPVAPPFLALLSLHSTPPPPPLTPLATLTRLQEMSWEVTIEPKKVCV